MSSLPQGHRSDTKNLLGEQENLFDDLLNGCAVRLDLMRILGGSKRRNRSFTVYQIPNSHILQDPGQFDIFPSLGKLKKPASCPFFYWRLQVYLQRGLQEGRPCQCPCLPSPHLPLPTRVPVR